MRSPERPRLGRGAVPLKNATAVLRAGFTGVLEIDGDQVDQRQGQADRETRRKPRRPIVGGTEDHQREYGRQGTISAMSTAARVAAG